MRIFLKGTAFVAFFISYVFSMSLTDLIPLQKEKQRLQLKEKRQDYVRYHGPFLSQKSIELFCEFLQKNDTSSPPVIAGYWAFGSEVDCSPLLRHLFHLGFTCALPASDPLKNFLIFRAWAPQDLLIVEKNFRQPLEDQPLLSPTVLLVPLLGFDKQGYRLGYGKGVYDKTLNHLRQTQCPSPIAVGVGFSIQECASLPHTKEDEQLDWILTENELHKIMI